MRQSVRAFHIHLFAIIALLVCAGAGTARGDSRDEARAHFQAGMKAYGNSDYRSALQEFTAAQQLSPADLNYYNVALCYDKLGEAAPAIENYREYLRRVPDAPKRLEIDASIARLDAALKSAAAKAEDAKRAEDIRWATAKQSQPEQSVAKPGEATAPATNGNPPGPANTGTGASGAGASGTPSSGLVVPTGDAQLDRVSSINIDAIRDQRGLSDRPSGAAPGSNDPRAATPTRPAPSGDTGPKATPLYKEWWFWAIVAVGAVVVYEVATTPSNSPNPRAQTTAPQAAISLFRF